MIFNLFANFVLLLKPQNFMKTIGIAGFFFSIFLILVMFYLILIVSPDIEFYQNAEAGTIEFEKLYELTNKLSRISVVLMALSFFTFFINMFNFIKNRKWAFFVGSLFSLLVFLYGGFYGTTLFS